MTERNNEDRIAELPAEPTTKTTEPLAPVVVIQETGLNFVSPTEYVALPSRGKFYPEGHPLKNKGDVEIRYMTAKEEDILVSKTLLKKGIALERMLENLIVDKTIKVDDLILGDKNAMFVAARISGYGSAYETEVTCPNCLTKSKSVFNLSEIKETVLPEVLNETGRGTFLISLPRTKVDVEVRLLLGKDERELQEQQENRVKTKQGENRTTSQMKKITVAVDGHTERKVIDSFIDRLPASDARVLREEYRKITPDLDMKQTFECAKCNFDEEIEVPLTVDFFWPK